MKIVFGILFFLLIAAVIFAAKLKSDKANIKETYKPRKLMTPNELEFFNRLVTSLPSHYIFPQVSMSALIEPATSDQKKAHSDRLRIAQQRVDYVVCDKSGQVIAIVELDDRTHSNAKDKVRDARCQEAGIRTVRFHSKNKPTSEIIQTSVFPEMSNYFNAEVALMDINKVELKLQELCDSINKNNGIIDTWTDNFISDLHRKAKLLDKNISLEYHSASGSYRVETHS